MKRLGRARFARSAWAETRGIIVSEENSEQTRAIEIASPTSPSQVLISVFAPTTRGKKTIREVRVAAVTAVAT
jgi:hypothetical protein